MAVRYAVSASLCPASSCWMRKSTFCLMSCCAAVFSLLPRLPLLLELLLLGYSIVFALPWCPVREWFVLHKAQRTNPDKRHQGRTRAAEVGGWRVARQVPNAHH